MRYPVSALPVSALIAAILAGAPALAAPVETGPRPGPDIQPFLHAETEPPAPASLIAALRQHVRYVFVLFQENRSFDSYFGTFPGANGLYSAPPDRTPGFRQPILGTDGSAGTISPFRIGPAEHAADLDDPAHSRAALLEKFDFDGDRARLDRFALVEERKYSPSGPPSLKARQMAELAMAHVDCDTIPFLWNYANRFVLYDAMFEQVLTASSPNAIAVIAAQTGLTQWARHPDQATPGKDGKPGPGVPVASDESPFWGSAEDHTSPMPRNPKWNHAGIQVNQTYASLPLSLGRGEAPTLAARDTDAARDLADLGADIPALGQAGGAAVPWGWYQEGFDREPTDPPGTPPEGTHLAYVTHHNGPQYFGYIANNPAMRAHMHGLGDFFADLAATRLPSSGVFYVRGGFLAVSGQAPDAASARQRFRGDDDHPGYSDSELSEALVAREINAIARSPYWAESAIIITYDESGGFYDHVPPPVSVRDPAGAPFSPGARIPLILVSPFARAHAIAHETATHASLVRLIDEIFALTPLANLPDEHNAARDAAAKGLANLGPGDAAASTLLAGFDPARLAGTAPPLPASYAELPDTVVNSLPHYGGAGCHAIGVTPEDEARGLRQPPPADFNPRPLSAPGG